MANRKIKYSILLALLIVVLVLGSIIFYAKKFQELKVVFLNVGQGDAILISQGNSQVLIDGGRSGRILLERIGKYIPFWDRQIETVVATHPDADHIGGLPSILDAYQVSSILTTRAISQTKIYQTWEEKMEKETEIRPETFYGMKIIFPGGVQAKVFYPFVSLTEIDAKNKNKDSIVMKLSYGENDFLLTGDLPDTQEAELIRFGLDVQSEILKVGHHGSKYSSSLEFLKAVNPTEAVISVGKNSYGHPNGEVLKNLMSLGIKIRRTDQSGDIVYKCPAMEKECFSVE